MKVTWTGSISALTLVLGLTAGAQSGANAGDSGQNSPKLKPRPQAEAPAQGEAETSTPSAYAVPPNAVPEGTRFIIKLRDDLNTRTMEQGRHFQAELREDLTTPSGRIIPKGRTIKGHVARFERGYMGARIMLALDEIETRHGWMPLIATVTGVPGDASIKSTGEEGEFMQKGPNKKRVIVNAAVGAGVGAATGAAAGGAKGAAVGAAVGAGMGSSTSWLFNGQDMRLDTGTQLEVRLDRDTKVPSR